MKNDKFLVNTKDLNEVYDLLTSFTKEFDKKWYMTRFKNIMNCINYITQKLNEINPNITYTIGNALYYNEIIIFIVGDITKDVYCNIKLSYGYEPEIKAYTEVNLEMFPTSNNTACDKYFDITQTTFLILDDNDFVIKSLIDKCFKKMLDTIC